MSESLPKATILVLTHDANPPDYESILKREVEYRAMEAGWETVRERVVDIVILDCGTDNAGCLEVLRHIKRIRPDLPVLFVTGRGSEEVAVSAIKWGAADYFRTPVNELDMRLTVALLLSLDENAWKETAPPSPLRAEPAAAERQTAEMPDYLQRAVGFIEDNFTTAITLDQIARAAGVSKFHLCRRFKRSLGMSPLRFVINRRIRRAVEILREKGTPIAEVAARTGFRDLSEFSRQFRKHTGLSPTEFRKSIERK